MDKKKQTYQFKDLKTGTVRAKYGSLNILVINHRADIDPDNKAEVKLAEDNGGKPLLKAKPKLKKRGK